MASVAPGALAGTAAGLGNIAAGVGAATAMGNAQMFANLAVNGITIGVTIADKVKG